MQAHSTLAAVPDRRRDVAVGRLSLAAVYAREVLTRKQEAWAWITPWLAAIALWSLLVVGMEFENNVSHYLVTLVIGLFIATPPGSVALIRPRQVALVRGLCQPEGSLRDSLM